MTPIPRRPWTTCSPSSARRALTCLMASSSCHQPSKKKSENEVEASDECELNLPAGALEKINDPVRIYLGEMGVVPPLTREGEVNVAKRIELGQLRTLKALSRSPVVVRQILAIGEDLKCGVRSIKEIVVLDEEEITEEILQNRATLK